MDIKENKRKQRFILTLGLEKNRVSRWRFNVKWEEQRLYV